MSQDNISSTDQPQATTAAGSNPDRKEYKVVSKNGLFKRGKEYPKGSPIELDEQTAKNFLAAGDIEEAK